MGLFNSKELKHLKIENDELKTKFQQMHGKEENMKHLDEVLKRLRLEVSHLNEEKKTIKESIVAIKVEELEKKSDLEALNKKIEHLNSIKEDLESQIILYTSQAEELRNNTGTFQHYLSDDPVPENDPTTSPFTFEDQNISPFSFEEFNSRKDEIDLNLSEATEKLFKVNEEEAQLIGDREERLNEISLLESKAKEYIQILDEIEAKIRIGNEKVNSLKQEELALKNNLEKKQKEISSFELQMKEIEKQYRDSEKKLLLLKEDERNLLSKIDNLKYDEQAITFKLENLKEEETIKENKIREIDFVLSEKDEIKNIIQDEQQKLMDELNEKKKVVNEAQAEYEKMLNEFKERKKELFDTEQTLSIKAQRLSSINIELLELEKKNSQLRSEYTDLENARSNIYIEIQKEKEIAEKFSLQNKKIVELVPLLEKRKQEIEVGNSELEERFTKMFQKFNYELNEINRKRTVLEQIVLQKEKDVDEKDQLLFEKLAALEESERILNTRQLEIEAFEQHLQSLKEQKDMFGTDLSKLDQEAIQRQSYNTDIKLETELLLKKKNALEQGLQDLLTLMNESYARSKERNSKFETELGYYEDQLQNFRSKIAESVKELDELRSSVGALKIEEQESKGNVDKLKIMKRRILEEIAKNQQVLQRYQKVREKLRIEPAVGKSFDEIPPKGKPSLVPQNKSAQIFKL